MLYDFHTHTFLSDGVLSPIELIRRAVVNGYTAIAVTDHVGMGDQERVLEIVVHECELATREMGILAIPGVELTHVPPRLIAEASKKAKDLGAKIVIVHGETLKEPVAPGTNLAALNAEHVDILAHPGLLSDEAAALAAQRGVYLELSARHGHSITNGRVAKISSASGAAMIVDSDAHVPDDLLTEELARSVAEGAGLDPSKLQTVLQKNPQTLIHRLGL